MAPTTRSKSRHVSPDADRLTAASASAGTKPFPVFLSSLRAVSHKWIDNFNDAAILNRVQYRFMATTLGADIPRLTAESDGRSIGHDHTAFFDKPVAEIYDFYKSYIQSPTGDFSARAFAIADEQCTNSEPFRCLVCFDVQGSLRSIRVPLPDCFQAMLAFEVRPDKAEDWFPIPPQILEGLHDEAYFCPTDRPCELRKGYFPIFSITDQIPQSYYDEIENVAREHNFPYRYIRDHVGDYLIKVLHTEYANDTAVGNETGRGAFLEWTVDEVYDWFRDEIGTPANSWRRSHFTSFTFAVIDDKSAASNEIFVCSNAPDAQDNYKMGPWRSRLKWKRVPIRDAIPGMLKLENLTTTYLEWDLTPSQASVVQWPPSRLRPGFEAQVLNAWGPMPASDARAEKHKALVKAIDDGLLDNLIAQKEAE